MKCTARISVIRSAFAVAAALAFSGQVQADTVNATLDSVTPLTKNVGVTVTSLSIVNKGEYAGQFNFTQNSGPLLTYDTNRYLSFCIDLVDTISIGSTHTWTVVDLEDAADPTSGPMNIKRAIALETLLGSNLGLHLNNADTLLTTNTQRAAMQIAVWEVVFEEEDGPYNVAEGNAIFANLTSSDITGQAQTYLDNIATVGKRMGGLVGLTSTSTQDFVGQVVPIPAAAWLFGSALIGAVALGRRRQEESEA